MGKDDIRWLQRLNSYLKALKILEDGAVLAQSRPLNLFEKQGILKSFEYTHELAWNVMKDYFEYQGTIKMHGSRDATREAFQQGLIFDGELWMDMIKSRNLSTHTYNEESAERLYRMILDSYLPVFQKFADQMKALSHA